MSLIYPSYSIFPIPSSPNSGGLHPSLLLPLSQCATSFLHNTRLCFPWKVFFVSGWWLLDGGSGRGGRWLLDGGSGRGFALVWTLCDVGALVGQSVVRIVMVALDISCNGGDCKVLRSSVVLFVFVLGPKTCFGLFCVYYSGPLFCFVLM
ncbi:hypothetical protein D8674_029857 [Pyrus ussuriensis x Pyrus communis]|uniref:Transmembrane protein n=1 Tax=Pyrus ussuriensis x Pyrus communis TaxID=2448454 RepID=A0A5N5I7J2_9ROSA|nr:hypothetical protein D8674_029857 [Pyrus ussuriensis x Pyrus communis]